MTKPSASPDNAPHFEMAESGNPTSLILATQRSFVHMLKDIIGGVKKDSKVPGLTWEQLDFLLDKAAEKVPTIIEQTEEM